MVRILPAFLFVFLLISCASSRKASESPGVAAAQSPAVDSATAAPGSAGRFRIAFGSCNRTDLPNPLWDDILATDPDLWIWGGDNIYADTDDAQAISAMYREQQAVPGYAALEASVPVIGTWDDHDFGKNDGGVEFGAKAASQQALLDFLRVPQDSPRRSREGVYAAHEYRFGDHSLKVIVLDTRYFRTRLQPDPSGDKRYIPNPRGRGTVLGAAQWEWLARELAASRADFNIIVSSIQLLSGAHGFESWGLFPSEQARMLNLISLSGASGVIVLSGDRHISEFSRVETPALAYPLIDFTSSGLTHAYRDFSGEPNPYRVGEVVARESFGLLLLDAEAGTATLQIRGEDGQVFAELQQGY